MKSTRPCTSFSVSSPADFELLETILSLYGEAVAGYYDGDTGELVVTATQDEFSPLEEATIVHELTHALTDQVLEFNDRYNQLFDEQRLRRGCRVSRG